MTLTGSLDKPGMSRPAVEDVRLQGRHPAKSLQNFEDWYLECEVNDEGGETRKCENRNGEEWTKRAGIRRS